MRTSHPTWVRGLKLPAGRNDFRESQSHPTWVRGLKLANLAQKRFKLLSHPTWVRGLKLPLVINFIKSISRTLRGCVD